MLPTYTSKENFGFVFGEMLNTLVIIMADLGRDLSALDFALRGFTLRGSITDRRLPYSGRGGLNEKESHGLINTNFDRFLFRTRPCCPKFKTKETYRDLTFSICTSDFYYFYLLINSFSGQFWEILTEVCKICTSAARRTNSKYNMLHNTAT